MNKDIEYTFYGLRITGAQLIEGIVLTIVFPIFLLFLRKGNTNINHVIHYGIQYGIPAGLTWIVRRYIVNYYHDKFIKENSI